MYGSACLGMLKITALVSSGDDRPV